MASTQNYQLLQVIAKHAKQIEYLRLESQKTADYIAFIYDAYMAEYSFGNVTDKRPDRF